MPDPLEAVTPLDGRYAAYSADLRPYASEAALFRARVRVEIEYLLAIAEVDAIDLTFSDDERAAVSAIADTFDVDDARRIKTIETEGDGDRPPTNHDVKAVEYWIRDELDRIDLAEAVPFVHFGLTSEDVNNLAYRLLARGAVEDVIVPQLEALIETVRADASTYDDVAMLARTHGQPASPTTYGKELAVYADRLARSRDRIDTAIGDLAGKLGGATGTFGAHYTVAPEVEWPAVARRVTDAFDLEYLSRTTQINPNDDLAALFDALAGMASICIDLDRDMWLYISQEYLVQAPAAGDVGSSTMPHKVNPIDFENSEGNLARARSELRFLADELTTSRLQRDLSDSTVMRNIGPAMASCHLGLHKLADGLGEVKPNEDTMAEELAAHPAVLAEAMQTALRAIGDRDAYERIKDATRGKQVTAETFAPIIEQIEAVDPALASRLADLEPSTYTGIAEELADGVAFE